MPKLYRILVYIPTVTNRHRYVMGFIEDYFIGRATVEIISSTDINSLERGVDLSINYSFDPRPGMMQMLPGGILESDGIMMDSKAGEQYLSYPDIESEHHCPFDLFGAIFFLLSRQEEYEEYEPDIHGRFPHQQSVLFKKGLLGEPVIDKWLKWLGSRVSKQMPPRKSQVTITMDVDHPFRIYGQPFIRKMGRYIIGVFSKNLMLKHYSAEDDPYNTIESFRAICDNNKVSYKVFFLVNDKGRMNSSTSIQEPGYINIIKETANQSNIGLHTGYNSANDQHQILKEKEVLEKITHSPIRAVRQHYIRFKLPGFYRHLLQLGIKEDYSMGYGGKSGYRAGTSLPFYWYDLQNEEITQLKIIPFCWMDSSSIYHNNNLTEELIEIDIQRFINHRKGWGADTCIILHNNIFADISRAIDWEGIINRNLFCG